jgi:hypothetical protein
MLPSVKYLERHKRLKILCAKEGKKILGIAPFKVTRHTFKGCFSYNTIEPLAYGNTDYSGIILTERKTECLKLFLEYLFNQKDWDAICLSDVPETSELFSLFSKKFSQLPNFLIEQGLICPYLPIPSSKQELVSGLNTKFRRDLRRLLRKLEREQGKVELREYSHLGSLEQSMQVFFDMHQRRWNSKGEAGVFGTQMMRDIFLDTATLFEKNNWLRLYFLTADKKPIATLLALEYNRKLFANISGIDPEYSVYSVGNLMILKVLELCVENKIREFDFMQGEEPYKFRWTNNYRRNFNIRFVNNKPKSRLIQFGAETLPRIGMSIFLEKILSI